MSKPQFADIILPLSFARKLTYRVSPDLEGTIERGKRVIVPVGRHKLYSGIVYKVHHEAPEFHEIKAIHEVLDEFPVVNSLQLEFWDWITAYYMCNPGDVMNCAVPSSLRLQSETIVELAEEPAESGLFGLDDEEQAIIDLLKESKSLAIQEIQRLFPGKPAQRKLKRLMEMGGLAVSEEVTERFKPLKEARVRLAGPYQKEFRLQELFQQMEQDPRRRKQVDALLFFLKALFDDKTKDYVRKSDLMKEESLSSSSIQTLIKNGILEEYSAVVDRIRSTDEPIVPPAVLSGRQAEVLDEIKAQWKEHSTVLLHGVTSSGKTEVYIHLMQEALDRGEQVLYLLPEIALTTQVIQRLRKHFGDQVGVYHSRYTGNERVEIWNQVMSFHNTGAKRSQIILGARSALFLPYSKLGLVIVDEEHDASYKQQDPAPRYHARDASIMLAKLHGAKVLLGSATPSLESYFNARQHRYGLVVLKERFGGVMLPEIIVTDIREAARKKLMKSHFSPVLLEAIRDALHQKEQVILFQNRRGFSPFLECRHCSWIPHCKNCSVTLTYHKSAHQLKCHYCGYLQPVPPSCLQCGDQHLEVKGFGTEKIEEEVMIYFPDCVAARLDLDAARSKASFHRLLNDFEERRIDLLVGTQMVSKGLDFEHVSTVGIMDADQLLNFPDFRSFERSFQLMAQVSGRSGRKNKRGKVIIQTRQPDHWVIRDVVQNNYEAFYQRDLQERRSFGYPPHARLIELTLRHKEEELVNEACHRFIILLKNRLGSRVHGPLIPYVSRVRNLFLRRVLIKIPKEESVSASKQLLSEAIREFHTDKTWLPVSVQIDVDPM